MKECFYSILGLNKTVTEEEIKKAYRRLALQYHPDKNQADGALEKFRAVQEAYECLSDAAERRYYDQHRTQILSEDVDFQGGQEDPSAARINLFHFFNSSCFDGYDADNPRNFFAVYGKFFDVVAEEERLRAEGAKAKSFVSPPFGDADSSEQDTNKFYNFWCSFLSSKPFLHADLHNINQAPDRWTRRRMESENQKARRAARIEFSDNVCELARWLKRRDPRFKKWLREKLEAQRLADEENRLRREKEEKIRAQRREDAKLHHLRMLEKHEEERRQAKLDGAVLIDDEASSSESADEEVVDDFLCELCHKSFRSQGQLMNHEKSKKHRQMLLTLGSHREESSSPSPSPDITVNTRDGEESEAEQEEGQQSASDASLSKGGAPAGDHGTRSSSSSRASSSSSSSSSARSSASEKLLELLKKRTVLSSDEDEEHDHHSKHDHRSKDDEEGKQQGPVSSSVPEKEESLKRRPRRRARDSRTAAAVVTSAPVDKGEASRRRKRAVKTDEQKCGICGQTFESRNQLFKHIKKQGHAQLKAV